MSTDRHPAGYMSLITSLVEKDICPMDPDSRLWCLVHGQNSHRVALSSDGVSWLRPGADNHETNATSVVQERSAQPGLFTGPLYKSNAAWWGDNGSCPWISTFEGLFSQLRGGGCQCATNATCVACADSCGSQGTKAVGRNSCLQS